MTLMQRAIEIIYPNQCAYCDSLVGETAGLCASCWRDTHFTTGHVCDLCATPLLGQGDGTRDHCDECLEASRPWSRGRAALQYDGIGRKLVLSLKYGDRTDHAASAGRWMAHAGADILTAETVLVPVPAHWRRLLSRRYNPAVELTKEIGRIAGCTTVLGALRRHRATPTQKGRDRSARFENLANAISPHPKDGDALGGRRVCVVDDTMASGATLSAACDAVWSAGAGDVTVLVLAKSIRSSYL